MRALGKRELVLL
uniref:Uncharacterized protein n=1 Tax=Zea mays TaxID=4577 RepID=C4J3S3_MAIZE|nr:unknown [Zea mays]